MKNHKKIGVVGILGHEKETNSYKITRDYEFEDKSELVFGKDKRRYRRKLERKIKGKKKFGFK